LPPRLGSAGFAVPAGGRRGRFYKRPTGRTQAPFCDFIAGGSALFVVFDIAVDQVGHVVVAGILFLQEGVVVVARGIAVVGRIVVGRRIGLGLVGLDFIEGDQLRPLLVRLVLVVVGAARERRGRRAAGDRLIDRAAFRSDCGIAGEVVKLRAAAHALAFQAEFRSGHGGHLVVETLCGEAPG